MRNIRYHIVNLIAVLLFSYTLASSINSIIRYVLQPEKNLSTQSVNAREERKVTKDYSFYSTITGKGFFRIPREVTAGMAGPAPEVAIDNLVLLGTITGPPVITRAMIMKKGEKNPGIFALWKINEDITNEVFGYKLVRVEAEKVTLESNGEKRVLNLSGKNDATPAPAAPAAPGSSGDVVRQNVSRAEIKQQVLNNLDNASKGLVVSPYRENNEVVGYRLKKVRPYNVLYKYGIRSGDIIRRINGHAMDSIEKFYKMWENLQTESRIVLDVDRDGKLMTFDLNITD